MTRLLLPYFILTWDNSVKSASTSDIIGSEVLGQVSRLTSGPYGGGGGEFFTDWWQRVDGSDYQPKNPPSQINIRAGGRVDSVQVIYAGYKGGHHGGRGGTLHRLRLYEGDRVVRVTGRAGLGPGASLDQITLHTKNGRVLGPYGGTGGLPFDTGDLGSRGCYLGYISGRADRRVDQLIIHWTCPKDEKQFSMVEPVPYTGSGNRVLLDLLFYTLLAISCSL